MKEGGRGAQSIRKVSPAEAAWLGLGMYILSADVLLWRIQKDTMSVQFSRWLQSRPGKNVCFLATAGLVAHLWWGVPLPFQASARRYFERRKEFEL